MHLLGARNDKKERARNDKRERARNGKEVGARSCQDLLGGWTLRVDKGILAGTYSRPLLH
jgi:hypothetical protein